MLNRERRYALRCSATRSEELNVMGLYSSRRDEMFIELRLYSTPEAPEGRDVPCLGETSRSSGAGDGCAQVQAINISPLSGFRPPHARLGLQSRRNKRETNTEFAELNLED